LSIHNQWHLSCNKLTESSVKDVSNSSNHTLFSFHYSEDIERAIAFDTNSTSERVIAYCNEDSTLQSKTIWVNDVKAKVRRRFTLIVMMKRYCVQYLNQDKVEKKNQRKRVLFMCLRLRSHFCLFHFTNYDIYWLMISCDQYLNDNKAQSNKKL
jgi:hypothetical protein